MITELPLYVYIGFGLATFLTVFFLFLASNKNIRALVLIIVLGTIQAILAFQGYFADTTTEPPSFIFLFPPVFILIILLFVTKNGKAFIDQLDLKYLTILHVVRIPVELTLYWLFLDQYVPELMTFSGWNFDILAGITAPFIFYLGYLKKKLTIRILLAWNIICLGLLFTIIALALLSAPLPFQTLAFDQPNIGVLYFPFIWLPGIIVPVVLFSHLASIRQLIRQRKRIE